MGKDTDKAKEKTVLVLCGHSRDKLKSPNDRPCCEKCDPETGKCSWPIVIKLSESSSKQNPKSAGKGSSGTGNTYKHIDRSVRGKEDFQKPPESRPSIGALRKEQERLDDPEISEYEGLEKFIRESEIDADVPPGEPELFLDLEEIGFQESQIHREFLVQEGAGELEIAYPQESEGLLLDNDQAREQGYEIIGHDHGAGISDREFQLYLNFYEETLHPIIPDQGFLSQEDLGLGTNPGGQFNISHAFDEPDLMNSQDDPLGESLDDPFWGTEPLGPEGLI